MGNCCLFLVITLLWSLSTLVTSQLQSSQKQVLLQIKKHLEYPKELDIWYDHGTDFCSLAPSAQVNLTCQYNSVTELRIIGDRTSNKVSHFHGFAIPSQTLSESFSMDSFVTTLTRLTSLRVLSLVSLGIWGPLPDKIHRLSSLEYLNFSSNFLFGSIPPKLSSMVKLQALALDDNFFNDTAPSWFGSLSNLESLSLRHNALSGQVPDLGSLRNLRILDLRGNRLASDMPILPKGLATAILSNNSFSGEVPQQYSKLTHLQHIDLSYNMLKGTIPAGLFSLPNINYVNLGSNMLRGSLPDKLRCGRNLEFVDITNNKLTGRLPSCLSIKSDRRVVESDGNCLSVGIHDQHEESYCKEVQVGSRKSGGVGTLVGIVIGIAAAAILTSIIFLITYRRFCPRGTSGQHLLHVAIQDNPATGFSSELLANGRFISDAANFGMLGLPASRSFTMEELNEATNNFDNSAFLGEGSYGKLYKGRLDSGKQVAVRCLPTSKKYSIRNLKLRLDLLAKTRHPHLVCVLGHCIHTSKEDEYTVNGVFLVYEYVQNGNFRAHLSGDTLSWPDRLAVLTGVAKAVQFLHTGVIPGFFSNRLKTNQILLNEHGVAKLSDYGLSIISDEIANSGAKSKEDKSWETKKLEDDVYSFGLIMLESIAGTSIIGKPETFLRDKLASLGSQDGRLTAIDPGVLATGSQESIAIAISITNKCICPELWSRPTFEDILWNLQYASQVQATADGTGRSSIYMFEMQESQKSTPGLERWIINLKVDKLSMFPIVIFQ